MSLYALPVYSIIYTGNVFFGGNNESLDEVSVRFGVRKCHIDAEKGFFLNHRPYRLIGAGKHQDRFEKGYAVSKEDMDEDMALIKEIGFTSMRLAHYQHAQYFYDLCDENGILVWAEIPYITAHMKEGRENTISQMTELIIQNYNHPSIYCWALSNEITTHGGVNDDLISNIEALNDLAHKLDSTRVTTMSHVFILKPKEKIVRIADVSVPTTSITAGMSGTYRRMTSSWITTTGSIRTIRWA